MINSIHLTHFKCFGNNTFPISPLTILSGINASGKSTMLQSIALLHQSAVEHKFDESLALNGHTISLGYFEDIINKYTGRDVFAIEIELNEGTYSCSFKADDKNAAVAIFDKGFWQQAKKSCTELLTPFHCENPPKSLNDFVERLTRTTYLSAERNGPREVHQMDGSTMYRNVGPRGERTAWYIEMNQDKQIHHKLRKKDYASNFKRQVEAWMNEFFPGYQMELSPVKRTNIVTLGLLTDSATGYLRPQNIGFGLSYTLPIIAACLGAEPNDIILLENPEAHLHPRGQSLIGSFLALVASTGIQVIVETHSDHVLNGVRKAVKDKTIANSDVTLHFFRPSKENEAPQVISPVIDAQGNVSEWPKGFFDQFDTDLEILTDWGN